MKPVPLSRLLLACTLGLLPACEELVVPSPSRSVGGHATVQRSASGDAPATAAQDKQGPRTYRELLAGFARAVPSREMEALRPYLSRRLAFTLPKLLKLYAKRFWRHLDRLAAGINSGYAEGKPRRRDDGRIELPVRFKNGGSATLMVVFQRGRPLIDRF